MKPGSVIFEKMFKYLLILPIIILLVMLLSPESYYSLYATLSGTLVSNGSGDWAGTLVDGLAPYMLGNMLVQAHLPYVCVLFGILLFPVLMQALLKSNASRLASAELEEQEERQEHWASLGFTKEEAETFVDNKSFDVVQINIMKQLLDEVKLLRQEINKNATTY